MKDVRFTHIGGPTVLLEVAGWRLLTDPTFDPPAARTRSAGARFVAQADRPRHRRLRAPPDPRGAAKPRPSRRQPRHRGPCPPRLREQVATTVPGAGRLGGGARGLEPWETARLEAPGKPTIEVTATPCRHGPPLSRPLAGHVVGFALRWEGPGTARCGSQAHRPLRRRTPGGGSDRVDTACCTSAAVRFPVTGPLRYSMTARKPVALCSLIRPRRGGDPRPL